MSVKRLNQKGRLSSTFVNFLLVVSGHNIYQQTQYSAALHTPDGDTLEYDTLTIFTIVKEGGELKVHEYKDFSDPEKRRKLHDWVAKAVAKKAA